MSKWEYSNNYRKKQRAENKKLISNDPENTMRKRYTKEDDDFILENFKTMKRRDIGYCIGKTEYSVNARVKLLREKGVIEKWNGRK